MCNISQMKGLFGALCLAIIVSHACAQGEGDMELWYKTPAKEWTEAMPVGNGRLGAMVFGPSVSSGTGVYRERIQLNEESVWGGSKINNNNPAAKANLPAIQQA